MLSTMWNEHATTQRAASRSSGPEKQRLNTVAKEKRKMLDKAVQSEKRKYWHRMQQQLLDLQTSDPKEYWRYVGNLGMGSTRKKRIPWEAVQSDGTITSHFNNIMTTWQEHFNALLNAEGEGGDEPPGMSVTAMQDDLSLDFAISIEEVRGSLAVAKRVRP